jgi:signal peptidase I
LIIHICFAGTAILSIVTVAIRYCFFIVHVDGMSMFPTLKPGDRLLVVKLFHTRWIRRSQIVVINSGSFLEVTKSNEHSISNTLVKFIDRLPGDYVETSLAVSDHYLRHYNIPFSVKNQTRGWYIPNGFYYIKSSGQFGGFDSEQMGPIPADWIKGIVLKNLSSI